VGEIFTIWAALDHEAVNTGAIIASHLADHAKPTSKLVIAVVASLLPLVGPGGSVNGLMAYNSCALLAVLILPHAST